MWITLFAIPLHERIMFAMKKICIIKNSSLKNVSHDRRNASPSNAGASIAGDIFCAREEWRPINGYRHSYEISSFGRIRSLDRRGNNFLTKGFNLYKGKIMSGSLDKEGYKRVHFITNDGKDRQLSIHRLVALAFISNPQNKECVNHLDCDITNNKVENLEWCTNKENVDYRNKLGRQARGTKMNTCKLSEKDILEIRKIGNLIPYWKIGKKFGISKTYVGRIIRRQNWKHI